MAGYNEILTGRFNRALQKLLSMKGPASMNELSSVLYPCFNFFWGTEMRYLEAWANFGQAFLFSGVAGANGTVRLRNPAGSNIIAVVHSIILTTTGANNQINVEGPTPTSTDLATDVSAFVTRFDARGIQATSLKVTEDNTAAHANNGNTIVALDLPANTPFQVCDTEAQEITILPGDALQVRGPTVATGMGATIWWRERQLEDSEVK